MSEMMTSARRTASHSVTLLKAAAGFSSVKDEAPVAANESVAETPRPALSVISANTQMAGAVTTTDALNIHGVIEGDVRAASITVCAGGKIKGDLYAEMITIHGAVEGRIEGQHVRLCAGAFVSGEIMHGSLGIDTAAIFEGSIKRVAAKIAAE